MNLHIEFTYPNSKVNCLLYYISNWKVEVALTFKILPLASSAVRARVHANVKRRGYEQESDEGRYGSV